MSEICPMAHKHTKSPEGYLPWFEWAEKKSRRHKQVRCKHCGRWAIWIR